MRILHLPIHVTSAQCGHMCVHTDADLTAYLLDPVDGMHHARPAIVVCPGGGYARLSEREDQPIAMEYLAAGYQVFCLHYSCGPDVFPRSLMELALAVKTIRENASDWNVDPDKIGVMGFSAGGHLACSLGTFYNREFLLSGLGVTKEEIAPNALILCYPVITSGPFCHAGSFEQLLGSQSNDPEKRELVSLEHQTGSHMPPVFLWHTWTDQSVPVENSLLLASALRASGVSVELHIYPVGKHGLSLATKEVAQSDGSSYLPYVQGWMDLSKQWLARTFT